MAFIIGSIKCWFCNEKDGILQSIHQYGHYGDVGRRHFYHQECLEMVEVEPEKFGHIMMDRAIYINDLKRQNNFNVNLKLKEKFKARVAKLQRYNFERMMPKK